MDDFLKKLIVEFQQIKDRINKLCESLTEEQFNFKPSSKRWSITECIAHLNKTSELYLERIITCLNNAKEKSSDELNNYKSRYFYKKFIMMLEPPYKIKVKTFKIFIPKSELNMETTISRFLNLQDELIFQVQRVDQLDLSNLKITSPASKLVKLKIVEAFLLVSVHQRRHIWQAEQIMIKK